MAKKYIDAKIVLNELEEARELSPVLPLDTIENFIESFPAADVQEVRHGRWIEQEADMDTIYECSVCGEPFVTIEGTPADNLWNYCPMCGASMDEVLT